MTEQQQRASYIAQLEDRIATTERALSDMKERLALAQSGRAPIPIGTKVTCRNFETCTCGQHSMEGVVTGSCVVNSIGALRYNVRDTNGDLFEVAAADITKIHWEIGNAPR
jgi:hypothetical protein